MVGRKKLLEQHFEVWKTAASFTPSAWVALFIVSICVLSEINEGKIPAIIRPEQKIFYPVRFRPEQKFAIWHTPKKNTSKLCPT